MIQTFKVSSHWMECGFRPMSIVYGSVYIGGRDDGIRTGLLMVDSESKSFDLSHDLLHCF